MYPKPEENRTLPKLLSNPEFILAAHEPKQWPKDEGIEIAFAGRSNVGKSSAINTIMQRRGLARTSRTPGRTQQIIFFELAQQIRIVDLPGYGYAKVPLKLRRHWDQIIAQFLQTRRTLRGLVLVMDARHPLTPLDQQMLNWCRATQMQVHILLTKSDKLNRGKAAAALQQVRRRLPTDTNISIQSFSALKREGVDQARELLVEWFGVEKSPGKTNASGA